MNQPIEPTVQCASAIFEALFGGTANESNRSLGQLWLSARARGNDRFILIQGPTADGEPENISYGTDVTASYPVRLPRSRQPNFVTVRASDKTIEQVVAELRALIGEGE